MGKTWKCLKPCFLLCKKKTMKMLRPFLRNENECKDKYHDFKSIKWGMEKLPLYRKTIKYRKSIDREIL